MIPKSSRKPPVMQSPGQLGQRPKVSGVKRSRSERSLSPVDNKCKGPEYDSAICLSGSDSLPDNVNDDITGTNRKQSSRENGLPCSQLSLAQQMNVEQLLRERFSRWIDGTKYAAPPEDRLPPRKRCKISQWQSAPPRTKEENESEDDFVVISHKACKIGFFHLACPFYIHSPDKHQKCLMEHDLGSIETLIKHLIQHHDKPLHCRTCRETFETLIDRDNHVLENACKRNNQKPLDGLTESQKVKLIKRDHYYLGEPSRWLRIWSTVLPSTEQPRSPYLDRGEGLKVSMIWDFWVAEGQQFVSDFVKRLESHEDEKNATYQTICKDALEGLVKWVIEQDSNPTILCFDK